MYRVLSPAEAAALPDDVLLSVQRVTRAIPPPPKAPPRWLARILPKSGLAGRPPGEDDAYLDEEDEDELEDEDLGEERAAVHELSFDVRGGEGLGLIGRDKEAIATLVRILIGGVPPTTGRVLVRGRVAPVSRRELQRLMQNTHEGNIVRVVSEYFHWPLPLIKSRWEEIEAFARVEELDGPLSKRRLFHRMGRLAVAAALHMDATVYVVDYTVFGEDTEYGNRCMELLKRRKAEGAAILQTGRMVDEVAFLTDEVLWIENGQVRYSGRPSTVAGEVHRNATEKVTAWGAPVTAHLVGDPALGGDAALHFELHVMRPNLELGFALQLTDDRGKVVELKRHDPIPVAEPGVFRLTARAPAELLEDRSYRARLSVEVAVAGHEPDPPRELIAFDVTVPPEGLNGAAADLAEGFVFLPLVDDELAAEAEDETWDVSRARS